MSDILDKRIKAATQGERIDAIALFGEDAGKHFADVLDDITRLTAALNILFPGELDRIPGEGSIDCAIRLLESPPSRQGATP